jgi:F-type H+-transporting ATPase subunit c
MFDASFFHYMTVGLAVGCNSIAVGIGEGITSLSALKAADIQPSARAEITRTFMLSMALIETSAIIGLTIAFMLLVPVLDHPNSFLMHYSVTGIGLAICLTGAVLGVAAALPAQAACMAVARQPFFSQKIQMVMLLTQSLMQTPLLFAFIISFFIKEQIPHVTSLAESVRLIAAGLCIGLGSVGPTIGLARFARQACESLGINRYAYNEILSFTLVSEAIIESPIIFSLVMSFALLGTKPSAMALATGGIPFIAAAIVMGLGTFGVGIGSGNTATKACKHLALNPESYTQLSRTSLMAQVLIETCSIYAFLIALFILLLQ